MLQCCVCRLSVTLCIVAKRCVLEQKLLLTAYRKSYMRNRLVPKWMTLAFVHKSYQGNVNHCGVNISKIIWASDFKVGMWLCLTVAIRLSGSAAYYSLLSVLWGSTVGYPSDSLASCTQVKNALKLTYTAMQNFNTFHTGDNCRPHFRIRGTKPEPKWEEGNPKWKEGKGRRGGKG